MQVAPEDRLAVAVKSDEDTLTAAMGQLADLLASAIRDGRSVVIGTDLDGTALPFNPDPMTCRVEPGLRDVFAAFDSLPGVEVVAITGGSGERTAHVLAASGLPIRALAVYGTQTVSRDGQVELHRLTSRIEPVMDAVRQRVNQAVQARIGLPASEAAVLDNATEAEQLGRLYSENKANIRSFQVKGSLAGDEAFRAALLDDVTEAAATVERELHNDVAAIFDEVNADLRKLGMPVLGREDGRVLKVEQHSGSIECIFPLGLSKETAMKALIQELRPAAVVYNADDVGDLPALKAVSEASAAGLETMAVAVYNSPGVPFAGLKGTPVAVVEQADVVVFGSRELGCLYGDALTLAAERNPDLTALVEAAKALPSGQST